MKMKIYMQKNKKTGTQQRNQNIEKREKEKYVVVAWIF